MSPFKEPQPRKKVPGATEPVIGGNWPPYAREGGEANWTNKGTPVALEVEDTPEAADFQEAINAALADLDYRKAALEAALTHAKTKNLDLDAGRMTLIAAVFEEYLRNGKPS